MTTATSTAILLHTTDAQFRAWGSAFSAILAASGLVQTADTGQINWATVTLPATSVVGGYEIWRFNDTLQGTTPIFIKIEYATASNPGRPAAWFTVASGSNGSGTLTGTTYSARNTFSTNTTTSGSTYPLFACHTEGFFGVSAFRRWASGSYSFTFFVCRTCDTSGTLTSTGVVTYNGAGALLRVVYVGGTLYAAASSGYCMIPGSQVTTLDGSGNVQLFRHFMMQPDLVCVPQLLSFYGGEISTETTFTATPVGVTAHTYLALSDGGGPTSCADGGATPASNRVAMLWE